MSWHPLSTLVYKKMGQCMRSLHKEQCTIRAMHNLKMMHRKKNWKKEGNEKMWSNNIKNGQNDIVSKNEKPFVIVVKMKRKCKKKSWYKQNKKWI